MHKSNFVFNESVQQESKMSSSHELEVKDSQLIESNEAKVEPFNNGDFENGKHASTHSR